MDRSAVILCIDGCSPDYLQSSHVPFLNHISREGCYYEVSSMIPSVTNVNAVSLLTGDYPDKHGITTNYYFDRKTSKEVFMESSAFIKTATLLEQGQKMGLKTALVTSKEKLRELLHRGAMTSFSAEAPISSIVSAIGEPPSIYSIEVNIWLLRALRNVIVKENPTLVFAMTTDYVMHTFSPETEESRYHMTRLDQEIERTYDLLMQMKKDVLLCIVADHGMSKKDRAVNLEMVLKEHGISSKLNTIIADRYVVHHKNLGGSAYIYLDNMSDEAKCLRILQELDGVEKAMSNNQASQIYHLDQERIGDIFVLGDKTTVFGLIGHQMTNVSLRSHGSLHEAKVPLIINQKISDIESVYTKNKDIVPLVKQWLQI